MRKILFRGIAKGEKRTCKDCEHSINYYCETDLPYVTMCKLGKLAYDAMRQVEGEIRLSDPYRDMIKLSKEDTEAVNGLVRWKRAYRKARK